MRKKFPVLFALLLLASEFAHAACPPTAEVPDSEEIQAAVRFAKDRGFLWRLRRDGHESYLYGTLHIGRLAWAMPGPTMRTALRATDTLAVELDISDPQALSPLTQMAPLDPPLSAALQQRLDEQIRAACLPEGTLSGMHPLLQVTTLEALAGRWDDLYLEFGQEVVLLGMAHSDGRSVAALETAEEQLAAIIPSDAGDIVPTIEKILAQFEGNEIVPILHKTAAAWSESDIVVLEHYEDWCNCVHDDQERSYMRNLVQERNRVGQTVRRIACRWPQSFCGSGGTAHGRVRRAALASAGDGV